MPAYNVLPQQKTPALKGQTFLVGARGFEPPTSSTPLKRATELRYAPTNNSEYSMAHTFEQIIQEGK